MENAAQPTPSPRCRRWRGILAEDAPGHNKYQKEQNNAAFHEWLKQPQKFSELQNSCQTLYQSA
jgi:hypothetical protein